MDAAGITVEAHLAELARAREFVIAHGQIAAGVQAEHYRGRVAGLYEHRVRLTAEPSDDVLLKDIERLLGKERADAIGAALKGSENPD